MSNVHLVSQNISEHYLGKILLLLIPIEVPILELLTDVSHLTVDTLFLELPDTTCSQVRDILKSLYV